MIRIKDITMQLKHTKDEIYKQAAKELGILPTDILKLHIAKRSLDARRLRGAKICYKYTVDVELLQGEGLESKILHRHKKNTKMEMATKKVYHLPPVGDEGLTHRPVIVGFGPAGMFAALSLARAGFCPIIIERGECVDARTETVEQYWETGEINPDSNVSFGEGGAGTFSDGKLNTMVKDSLGRNYEVMRTFVMHGADEEILYDYKPHIGTDVLREVVKGIRTEIQSLGGEFRFNERLEEVFVSEQKRCQSLRICRLRAQTKEGEPDTRFQKESDATPDTELQSKLDETSQYYDLDCEVLVLAIGHSARDTFAMLYQKNIPMAAKSFAVGLRIQHPQRHIDVSQFGEEDAHLLSPAPYKLTAKSRFGRGVYSFCMCPGGYVVAASTEAGKMVVNGMSYHKRDSGVANSAIIVTVNPADFVGFGEGNVLDGMAFQRALEEKAYALGKGKIPVQLYGDFKEGKISSSYGSFLPKFKGQTKFAPLHTLFFEELYVSILEAMDVFHKKIKGFAMEDAVLAGVESRTSSPIQILRNEMLESDIGGLYPCGEGAGYAGGITSAAMDGLKVAESIIKRFCPMDWKE